jgi:hypothetical protein
MTRTLLDLMRGTLGQRLAWRDEERFVGREHELAVFDDVLVPDPPASVVFLHGPGGVGKSTLLREIARRGEKRGFTPCVIEGRDLAPVPGQLEEALDGVQDYERPLLLFDTYERMAAAGGWLRQSLLPTLPAGAVVVLAGRGKPEPGWTQDGWERLTLQLELKPLTDDDAEALIERHGVADRALVARLVRWAQGSPLALALGADAAATRGDDLDLGELDADPDLARTLLQRLARAELDGADLDVLAVAAIARVTNASMLRDALPDVDPEEAYAFLRGLSFTEVRGGGVALHDRVRRALRADLRDRSGERERELRRRVADHLHRRAIAGEPGLCVDLAALSENSAVRWGFGAEGSVTHRVDDLRASDLELARTLMVRRYGGPEYWEQMLPLLDAALERIVVVRDRHDRLAGFSICVTPHNAPAVAESDQILGPWLQHARATIPDGDVLIWRDALDFTAGLEGDIASPVLAMLNTASTLRSGLVNPRYAYLPIDPDNEVAAAFAQAVGATHIPELDISFGPRRMQCHLLDHGPGGILGNQRDQIYRELGLNPPRVGAQPPPPRPIDVEDVRDALRNLHQPLALAASPLASGTTPDERSESVRALLRDAVDGAFGESYDEDLQRRIVERGYFDPQGGHERAAMELNVSRATYFRRLRRASERVADWIIARGGED